jgi:predicted RNase H-like HicB family nuclease
MGLDSGNSAIANGQDALEDWLETRNELKLPIPEPGEGGESGTLVTG